VMGERGSNFYLGGQSSMSRIKKKKEGFFEEGGEGKGIEFTGRDIKTRVIAIETTGRKK